MSGVDNKTLRILLIEDSENDALLLVDYLESNGRNFEWQRVDTEAAMLKALEQEWDMVLSDYSMPHFNGGRALEILRQHDQDLPFIFVSGTIGEEAAVKAMKAGAQDYVMKGQLARLLPTMDRELREVSLRRERRKSEQMLRKLSLVVNQAAESVFITSPNGCIEYVNPAFEKMTGYDANEVIGKTPAILRSGYHGDAFYGQLWTTISQGDVFSGTLVNKHKSGELFHEEKVITPLKDSEGHITHYVSTGRDITSRVRAEDERRRLSSILEATPDLVAILDPDGSIRYLNGAGRRLLGFSLQESIEGRPLQEVFQGTLAQKLDIDILPTVRRDGAWKGETVMHLSDGSELPVSQITLAHSNAKGEVEFYSTIARDISERKRFEAELQHRATHDILTGLPNRFYLLDRFKSALKHAHRNGSCVAVFFMDMNNFKRVNDTLGHAAGDALLRQVAKRLRSCLRPNDIIARHGGDEFTIVVSDLAHEESALALLGKLRKVFELPLMAGSQELYVTFSTGIALYPHDGEEVEDLLRHADAAMYRAKSSGSSQYRFYAPDMNARGHELLKLEADLRHALAHEQFILYCQPQVDLSSGHISGVEGLIRWRHPQRGLVAPNDFIPLLENSNMIIPVGEWVIRQACIIHRRWREAGFGEKRIAVNVSAAQFNDEHLLERVSQALKEEEMPPQALELEITENTVMHDPESAAEVLQALHALGVRTAVDDFGTGYSSLAYLKRFPLTALKIDQGFVGDLGKHNGNVIVEASISLAQKLGLEIVAEGVETARQLNFLRARDCTMAQGYFFSKPMPCSELMALMPKRWQW